MMKLLHTLRNQLRIALAPSVVVCALAFVLFQFLGVAGPLLGEYADSGVSYLLPLSMESGTVFASFLVLPTLPFAFSLVRDLDTHAALYWTVRSGSWQYTLSKGIAAGVSGASVIGLGMLLWIGVLRIFTPWSGSALNSDPYTALFMQGEVFLPVLLYVLHFALTGAWVGVCGMFFSLLANMKLAAFAGPLVLNLVLSRLLTRMRAYMDPKSVFFPGNWDFYVANSVSAGRALGEKTVFVVLFSAAIIAVMVPLVKRRVSNG